ERIGNLNYPESARGRIYGSLRLTVSINSDGTLAAMDLERSSGHKILDAAAQRIVQLAAPYAKFPSDIRKETDILVITRTWHLARDGQEPASREVRRRRLDHYAAARKEPVPFGRAQLAAEGAGSDSRRHARSRHGQAPHFRNLSERRGMGRKRLRSRSGGTPL